MDPMLYLFVRDSKCRKSKPSLRLEELTSLHCSTQGDSRWFPTSFTNQQLSDIPLFMRREGKVHRLISAKLCLFVVTLINITIILLHHVDHLKNSLPGRRGHLSWMLRAEHSGVMMGLPWLKRWVTDPKSFKGFFHKSRRTKRLSGYFQFILFKPVWADIFRSNSNCRRQCIGQRADVYSFTNAS